jgi:hypothetical protein
VAFYGGCVKICEGFAPNFGDKRTGCCIMTTQRLTLPFSPEKFVPKITLLLSSIHPILLTWPPYGFAMFPRLKIKLESHHFDTIEVIKAESQAVSNTQTEHDFWDAF